MIYAVVEWVTSLRATRAALVCASAVDSPIREWVSAGRVLLARSTFDTASDQTDGVDARGPHAGVGVLL